MIATIILLTISLVKLGINLAHCKDMAAVLGVLLGTSCKLALYYYAGLFDKFM